ncbi:MAG: cob(I)yrinic acid a,c-diamide adenosyltransferase [Myxococcales bacterium]|nr:cob(I)yrinic acid a,c-diamide adenosyltransferase [Myxococcales bacterium]
MKVYTKTGDRGETGLFGGARVSKASARVDAYGDVDELNSTLGMVLVHAPPAAVARELERIQGELFQLGAELSCVPGKSDKLSTPLLDESQVLALETAIDCLEERLEPLTSFVLPGGSASAAALHVARTVCRRAERKLVALIADESLRPELIRYLNRLSDLLFVMARFSNAEAKRPDVPWNPRTSG